MNRKLMHCFTLADMYRKSRTTFRMPPMAPGRSSVADVGFLVLGR